MIKSKGHIGFDGALEYYYARGNVYTACTIDPVMPDGYRCGRFLCTAATFVRMPRRGGLASEMSMGIGAQKEEWFHA